ncbi:hypothetical protein IWQ62_001221 [Dispira parvispora]|uniref:HMG box domain-containing protein n=1 Tax=Dispira parvispora TaxID=1520584 RepID=A0A9W8AWL8_9FUNG|nr:hypothetical protein IWQ62_001221 [Dispira parvispora]
MSYAGQPNQPDQTQYLLHGPSSSQVAPHSETQGIEDTSYLPGYGNFTSPISSLSTLPRTNTHTAHQHRGYEDHWTAATTPSSHSSTAFYGTPTASNFQPQSSPYFNPGTTSISGNQSTFTTHGSPATPSPLRLLRPSGSGDPHMSYYSPSPLLQELQSQQSPTHVTSSYHSISTTVAAPQQAAVSPEMALPSVSNEFFPRWSNTTVPGLLSVNIVSPNSLTGFGPTFSSPIGSDQLGLESVAPTLAHPHSGHTGHSFPSNPFLNPNDISLPSPGLSGVVSPMQSPVRLNSSLVHSPPVLSQQGPALSPRLGFIHTSGSLGSPQVQSHPITHLSPLLPSSQLSTGSTFNSTPHDAILEEKRSKSSGMVPSPNRGEAQGEGYEKSKEREMEKSKPKRPMNAFLIFANERRAQLKSIVPPISVAEQSKLLGDEWAKMSNEQQQLYYHRAKELKDKFIEENPDFVYTRRPNNTRQDRNHRHSLDSSDAKGSTRGPRLKRPMNSYLIFNQDRRHRLLSEHPNMTVSEISRAIGNQWRSMSDEEKLPYVERAQQLKEAFRKNNPGHVFTRRSKKEIARLQAQLSHRSGHGSSKKRPQGIIAPKHPMSAFLFFLREHRPLYAEQYPGSSVGPISKVLAEKWNNMSVEERLPWQEQADHDKARYARERAVFMGDQGDDDDEPKETPGQ